MKKRILIVDDEESILWVLTRFLRKHSYEATVASNASEALQQAEKVVPDLIILDINLGADGGLDLLKALKAKCPGVPVIILTGMGFEEVLFQQAKENGADGYTSKAPPLTQLLTEIHRVLRFQNAARGSCQEVQQTGHLS